MLYFEQAFEASGRGELSATVELLLRAAQVARTAVTGIEEAAANTGEDVGPLGEELTEKQVYGFIFDGFAHFFGWMTHILVGRLKDSLISLERSREAWQRVLEFDAAESGAQLFLCLTSAMDQTTRALDALLRLEFATAAILSQRAQATLEGELSEEARERGEVDQAIGMMLVQIEALLEKVSYRSRRANSDYRGALRHAERTRELLEGQLRTEFGGMPAWTAVFMRLELRLVQSECADIAASLAQDEQRWEEAMTFYEVARSHLLAAARTALDLPFASAHSIQERLQVQAASLETTISRCRVGHAMWRENKLLRAELESLRQGVMDSLKSAGVSVHSNAEAVATVEQTTVIVNRLEKDVRDIAAKLEAAVGDNEMDPESRASLLAAIGDISRSQEHGVPFLERAKKAAGVIAKLTRTAGEGAANIAVAQLTDSLLRLVGLSPP